MLTTAGRAESFSSIRAHRGRRYQQEAKRAAKAGRIQPFKMGEDDLAFIAAQLDGAKPKSLTEFPLIYKTRDTSLLLW